MSEIEKTFWCKRIGNYENRSGENEVIWVYWVEYALYYLYIFSFMNIITTFPRFVFFYLLILSYSSIS